MAHEHETEIEHEEYDLMVELERLESLREEMEELGVHTLAEIQHRIAELHHHLDTVEHEHGH